MISRFGALAIATVMLAVFAEKEEKSPSLGMAGAFLDEETLEILSKDFPGLPAHKGLWVTDVTPDSNAEAAGIKKFDVIVSVDRIVLTDEKTVSEWLKNSKEGRKYRLTLWRVDSKSKWAKHVQVLTMRFKVARQHEGDAANGQGRKAAQKQNVLYAMVATEDGNKQGELRLEWEAPHIYLLQSGEGLYFDFCKAWYKENSNVQHETAGFFKVGGRPAKLEISSDNHDVLAIEKQDGLTLYRFKKDGAASLLVSLGGRQVAKLPLKVERLPIDRDASADKVVESIGLPDDKKKVYVSWPDTETHDGIIYSPDAGEAVIAEHWRFNKYRGAVFSVQRGKLRKVRSNILRDNSSRDDFSAWADH